MVSTRQMTIGNNGSNDRSEQQQINDNGPAKYTRNSAMLIHTNATSTIVTADQTNLNQSSTSSPSSSSSTPQKTVNVLELPQEIIEKIFSYLSFKNICQLRLVCTRFDRICGNKLNKAFHRLQGQLLERFQTIKKKMPRRESARRNHHLACESDIIETLHMRLTLLQMSLGKHIERKHCCFFPGEILDEIFNILHYIKTTPKLARPYKVTDELFDLSTMAMEYFKEKIEPDLPEIAYFSTDFLEFSGGFPSTSTNKFLCLDSFPIDLEEAKDSDGGPSHDVSNVDSSSVETTPQSNMVLRKRIRKIKQGMKRYNSQLSLLRQDLRTCKRKTAEQQKQIAEQQKQLAEQQKQTLEYATRLDENDKKNEEISRKFSTLLQELNKCKTELQYWRSKSPATLPFCTGCGNVIMLHPEELEALVNQGVNPEGLGLEPADFKPIDNQVEDLTDITTDIIINTDETKHVEEEIPYVPTTSVKKRKLEEIKELKTTTTTTTTKNTSNKKTRRILKPRTKKVKN